MTMQNVLSAVHAAILASQPAQVKTVFDPGKPFIVAAQYMPSIIILPLDWSSDYDSEQTKETTYRVEIDILTEDFTRIEQRVRGDASLVTGLMDSVVAILEANPTLNRTVDELVRLEPAIQGPSGSMIVIHTSKSGW
jgi:hypothetical protein